MAAVSQSLSKKKKKIQLTLFSKHVYVADDSPEEGSLLGVIVHAVGHQFGQFFAVWCGKLALSFIKSLLLLKIKICNDRCVQQEIN